MKVAILDGYVDEPSCLGVPPYIAPYPRYIYGMLKHFGINAEYVTIDQFRGNDELRKRIEGFDIVIVISGIAVPGKYLGGNPLSFKELRFLFPREKPERKVLVGPIVLEMDRKDMEALEGYTIIDFPFEGKLFEYLANLFGRNGESFSIDRFAVLGAEVVRKHPDFPHVICEIETYRGCYWRKCSFCIERIHGKPKMREPGWVVKEIEALYWQGVRHFRLGRQTDFLTYMADFRFDVPKPDPEFMRNFHREIWRRCPQIKTLHLDNVNPKTIAEYPEESREIIKTIVLYQTPGNVAAMGLESADERVIELNNLASTPEDAMFAIEIINRYGRYVGYNGLPYFLPGINFVAGLKGETKETFDKNFDFLREVYERDLLLRRINIRQVKIVKGTPMEKFGSRNVERHKKYFKIFKRKVRTQIDNVMLKKIVPVGRKITDLRCEVKVGKITFARQLATYPLLVGLVGKYERNTYMDARVVDYGMRSITAIETPLNVNTAKLYQLEAIPGIGKAMAARIVANRPYRSVDELKNVVSNFDDVKNFLSV